MPPATGPRKVRPLTVTTTGAPTTFNVTVNKAQRHQTIDGFGFFGAMNTWWSSASSLWSDAWGDQVISDLGITIWRNEYYPPSDQFNTQDADWNKQRAGRARPESEGGPVRRRSQVHLHGLEPALVDEGRGPEQRRGRSGRRTRSAPSRAGRSIRRSTTAFADWLGARDQPLSQRRDRALRDQPAERAVLRPELQQLLVQTGVVSGDADRSHLPSEGQLPERQDLRQRGHAGDGGRGQQLAVVLPQADPRQPARRATTSTSWPCTATATAWRRPPAARSGTCGRATRATSRIRWASRSG